MKKYCTVLCRAPSPWHPMELWWILIGTLWILLFHFKKVYWQTNTYTSMGHLILVNQYKRLYNDDHLLCIVYASSQFQDIAGFLWRHCINDMTGLVYTHPHWASMSASGIFVFNTNWLFWLSVISRVLFLHICPLFCTFINHRVFFVQLASKQSS